MHELNQISAVVWVLLLVLAMAGGWLIGQRGAARDDAVLPRLEPRFDAVLRAQERQERELRDEFARSRKEAQEDAKRQRDDTGLALQRLGQSVGGQVVQLGNLHGERLDAFATQLAQVSQSLDGRFEALRMAVEGRLAAIQTDNALKLEEMRRTVDEKLQTTLEQRLGESFRLVGERLEQVHRGLGEMQVLAAGVGDLKRVLTNVKTRGTWGEVQLGALLDQVMTAEQYACNVATRPGSAERVEYAIRLPGRGGQGDEPVWLPIDAKFPVEDYQKLLDAQDRADPVAAEEAGKALDNRLRLEARAISEKYVEPPYTTDFAVLFLPTEGLYAEVLRRPGLAETLQRDWRVTLAGPTTLAAMLNSLQMGFRTLAIERRSSEVWSILGAVKSEFGKFGEALAHTKKKLEEASNSIGKAETRSRVLSRRLKDVEGLSVAQAEALLPSATMVDDDED